MVCCTKLPRVAGRGHPTLLMQLAPVHAPNLMFDRQEAVLTTRVFSLLLGCSIAATLVES